VSLIEGMKGDDLLRLLAQHDTRCMDSKEDRHAVALAVLAWHEGQNAQLRRQRDRWAARVQRLERRLDRVFKIASGKDDR